MVPCRLDLGGTLLRSGRRECGVRLRRFLRTRSVTVNYSICRGHEKNCEPLKSQIALAALLLNSRAMG